MKLTNFVVHILQFFNYSFARVSALQTVYDCRLEPIGFLRHFFHCMVINILVLNNVWNPCLALYRA